jgi:NADPH:quinone reductase-like Zn-dependent oxidoreductase
VVGLADGGSWSELVAVPVERLAVLPPTVSFTAGGALPVVGLTALRALRALGDVVGRDLLVTGASGAVGNVAARLALLAGARVTGLARRHVTIEGVRFVTALAAEDRFHRVIDAVGGDVLSDALRHLRPDARVVFFGILTGSPTRFDLATFYGSSPRSTISPLFVFDAPGRFDDDLAVLVRFVEEKRLTPVIDRAFSSDAVNEALEAMSSSAAGKIVLTRDSAPQ